MADVTNTDRASALAALINARDALALSFQILTQIGARLGGLPQLLIDTYNKQADALFALESRFLTQMRTQVAGLPNGQTLLQFLPTNPLAVPHIVLPSNMVLGAVKISAATELALKEMIEQALAKRTVAKEVGIGRVGRAINWQGVAIGAGLVGSGLIAVNWLTKADQADANLAEAQSVIITRALALYDKSLNTCLTGGGDQSNCLGVANKAFSDFLSTAKQGLPDAPPSIIMTLGYIVAGSVTLLVGYRMFVRYQNRQWPFTPTQRMGTSSRRRLPAYEPDDDDDGDFDEATA